MFPYLADFIIVRTSRLPEGEGSPRQALEICGKVGVPIAGHRTEGPSSVTTFLGIELATEAYLQKKLVGQQREISRWRGRCICTGRSVDGGGDVSALGDE